MRKLWLLIMAFVWIMPVQAQDDASVAVLGDGFRVDTSWGAYLAASTSSNVLLLDDNLEVVLERDMPGGYLSWNGDWLAIGSHFDPRLPAVFSGDAVIWDTMSDTLIHTFSMDDSYIRRVYWHEDTAIAPVSSTEDDLIEVRLWRDDAVTVVLPEVPEIPIIASNWTLDADGNLVATGQGQRHVYAVPSGELLEQAENRAPQSFESPDGRFTASLDGGAVVVSGEAAFELQPDGEFSRFRGFREVIWSADSRYLAALGRGALPDLVIAGATSGERLLELTYDESGIIAAVHFNPQGEAVAVVDRRGNIFLYDLRGGALVGQKWLSAGGIDSALSPDGTVLAVVDGRSEWVYLWDVDTQKAIGLLQNPANDPTEPANYLYSVTWSPDGRYVAVGAQRGGVVENSTDSQPIDLLIYDVASGELFQTVPAVAFDADIIFDLHWHGRYLAYAVTSNMTGRSHIGVWDVENAEMIFQPSAEVNITEVVVYDARLAFNYVAVDRVRETGIQFVDLTMGALTERFLMDEGVRAMAWSPEGDYIAVLNSNLQIILYDAVSGEALTQVNAPEARFSSLVDMVWHDDQLATPYIDEDANAVGVTIWDVTPDAITLNRTLAVDYDITRFAILGNVTWSANRIAVNFDLERTFVWTLP